MNLVDCYVKEVLSAPYQTYGRWFVKVKADSWGHIFESTIMFSSEEDALKVGVGYHFVA